MGSSRRGPVLLALAAAAACAVPAGQLAESPPRYLDPEIVGTIDTPGLVELSGLAASRQREDTLWAHNDSLNEPLLYALGGDGMSLGSVRLEAVSYIDWEDIASFEWDGQPYLIVGDIGDNKALRPFVSLWVVREPEFRGDRIEGARAASVAWELHYRYEDGPRDCESLAVDEAEGRILLLSKRTDPPVLYELPLAPSGEGHGSIKTARRLAEVRVAGKPTGLDVSPDGTRAAVQTKRRTYVFHRREGQAWSEVFAGTPQVIEMPSMPSIEAVSFDRGGRSLFVTREQRPNPLLRIDPATE